MAIYKPGRLYRKLEPTEPIFNFTYGDTTLTDTQIRSVSIHHGGESLTPSTIEVSTTEFDWVNTGKDCSFSITAHGMARLKTMTGDILGGAAPRFTGRVGRQTVDDRGGTKRFTSFYGASLSAQYPRMNQTWSFAAGTYIDTMLRTVMQPTAVPSPPLETPVANYRYGQLAEDLTNVRFSDITGQFINDLGFTYRELRDGRPQLLTHEYRNQAAIVGLETGYPLSRSQAVSPATWEQANEVMPRRVKALWLDEAGELQSFTAGIGETSEIMEIDMTHARFIENAQPVGQARALRARESLTSYELPEIKIDLLYLLSSPHMYHRQQAANLLDLHIYDAIYFSGDWLYVLRGMSYVEEITETIGPDQWTLTLKLSPSESATGVQSPQIPARTWEQSNLTWDEETRTWEQA